VIADAPTFAAFFSLSFETRLIPSAFSVSSGILLFPEACVTFRAGSAADVRIALAVLIALAFAFADANAAVAFAPLLLALALVPISGTVNAAIAITSTTINAARFIFIVCPSPKFFGSFSENSKKGLVRRWTINSYY
jgi:hypothetical protein